MAVWLAVLLCPVGTVRAASVVAWGAPGQISEPLGLGDVVVVAAGSGHSVVLRSDGTVVAWGGYLDGSSYVPMTVPAGLSGVAAIAAGYDHDLAVTAEGRVVGWGYDKYGQTDAPSGLSNVVKIAAGGNHSLALKNDGTVVAWGAGATGSGSWPNTGQAIVPVGLIDVIAIAAGNAHSLAFKRDGTVVAWGSEYHGGTAVPAGLVDVVAIAAGGYYSLALRSDGTVAAWGDNSKGQTSVPSGLRDVVAIAAAESHSLALKSDGTVVSWGQYWDGNFYVPATVPAYVVGVVAIAAGSAKSLVLTSLGSPFFVAQPPAQTVFSGVDVRFDAKALGTAPLRYQWQFNGIPLTKATNASLVLPSVQLADAGSYTVAASNALGVAVSRGARLTVVERKPLILVQPTDQGVYVGGQARFQVVADGSRPLTYQWRFGDTDIGGATNALLALSNATRSQAGAYSVRVRNALGSTDSAQATLRFIPIVGWGDNCCRQTTVPATLVDVVAVAAGGAHNLALGRDGTVTAWGNNSDGQATVPVGLLDVVAIAAGDLHSLALERDGTVVAWGGNTNHQTTVPVELTNVVAIAAGSQFSLALERDGTRSDWPQRTRMGPPLGRCRCRVASPMSPPNSRGAAWWWSTWASRPGRRRWDVARSWAQGKACLCSAISPT
jgi:alpha-tubulin suppressor-like RCC1 family protein